MARVTSKLQFPLSFTFVSRLEKLKFTSLFTMAKPTLVIPGESKEVLIVIVFFSPRVSVNSLAFGTNSSPKKGWTGGGLGGSGSGVVPPHATKQGIASSRTGWNRFML